MDKAVSIRICQIYVLQGISSKSSKTLESININLFGQMVEFHLILDNLTLPHDGILGTDFLMQMNDNIYYKKKYIHCHDISIPFDGRELIYLKSRTVTPSFIIISNPEVQSGYVTSLTTINGVYYGNAIVTNTNCKAYLPIFNTTESNFDLEVPIV